MTQFRSIVENILNEADEFEPNDIVALKMNPNKVGIINQVLGEKFGRLYYKVVFPTIEKHNGKINIYVTDNQGTYYSLAQTTQPIPGDQLRLASEEELTKVKQQLIDKYNIKSKEDLIKYGYL